MEKLYADIIINISHEALDKVFAYKVPFSMIKDIRVGQQVVVPFGRSNKEQTGYVVNLSRTVDYDESKVKEILRIETDHVGVESNMIELAAWIRENYGSTMIQALKTVLPVQEKVARKARKYIELCIEKVHGPAMLDEYFSKHYVAKARLLAALLDHGKISWEMASKDLKISKSTVDSMEREGILHVVTEYYYRNPGEFSISKAEAHVLNEQQQELIDEFREDFLREDHKTYLLHGITGSGKTEVYLAAIEEVIKQGKQAIVLIPEIALTYQTVTRFTKRFGERVSILNSRLSKGERYDQFERAKNGDVDIMIGPRSALFTPFKNLGLIIIDEEHESAYKSESVPKYHATEVAIKRVKDVGATLVLGSATPSVESYYRAKNGAYKLHVLNKREKGNLPEVHVVDLREELKNENKSIFSIELQNLIKDRLEKKQQTMLFINRRGYAGFVSCRDCGEAIKCPHCDVTLKLHRNRKLVCHYCGHTENMPTLCPKCGSKYLGGFGIGTQQIETAVKKMFPHAKVLRMDADTTSKKGGHDEILSAFANREADILVGTQMIVKGHDFPGVTLVGVIAADMSLYSSDYCANERTFQLICQAAGRAGRGELPGIAIVQTYSPDNYSIETAGRQNYEEFYEEEIAYRKLMKYPPVSNMVSILLQGREQKQLIEVTNYLVEIIKNYKDKYFKELFVIGPADPPVGKINDIYRKIIYLKSDRRQGIIQLKNYLEDVINSSQKFKKINIQFDFKA